LKTNYLLRADAALVDLRLADGPSGGSLARRSWLWRRWGSRHRGETFYGQPDPFSLGEGRGYSLDKNRFRIVRWAQTRLIPDRGAFRHAPLPGTAEPKSVPERRRWAVTIISNHFSLEDVLPLSQGWLRNLPGEHLALS